MNTRKTATLLHEQILKAAEKAISYVEGYGEVEFLADSRTQDAVSMQLIVIGEMANRILRDPAMSAACRDLPLHLMQGMRNRIAHGYREIDMTVVWETTTHVLPELVIAIETLLKGASTQGGPQAPHSSTGDH